MENMLTQAGFRIQPAFVIKNNMNLLKISTNNLKDNP